MRALQAVVNDIARAMRRQGKRLQKTSDDCEWFSGQLLLNYADLLTSATKRKPKRVRPLSKAEK